MNARSGGTYYAESSGGRSGGVGSITLGLKWPDGSVAVAATTAGIIEVASGSYVGTRTAPVVTATTTYIIVWTDPVTHQSVTEELIVSGLGAPTSGIFYASPDEVRAYLGLTSDQVTDETLAQPIVRAQRDVDTACGRWLIYPDTGLKFATGTTMTYPLTDLEARLLSDAVCAQVEYRMTVGDDFLIREQYASQSGPGYATAGLLKKVCGAAYSKLGQGGFLKLTGQVTRRRRYYIDDQTSNYPYSQGQDRHFGDWPRDSDILPRAN